MSKKPNRVVQYRIANEKFLEQKAQEEGIRALESGILLREIEKGSGTRAPQLKSTVYVHYDGDRKCIGMDNPSLSLSLA